MINTESSVTSLAQLMDLEGRIHDEVRKHPLDQLLLGLRGLPLPQEGGRDGIPRHVVGVATRFATRFGIPGPMMQNALALTRSALAPLMHLVGTFAHADPCAWLGGPSDPILPLFLRHVGNQFPYNINTSGKWGRAEILFNELPNTMRGQAGGSTFDFHRSFEALTGFTVSQFIDVGYMAYCAAAGGQHLGFTRGYFEKARQDGFTIADDNVVRKVLVSYAADSATHANLSIKLAQNDRNYAAYDFNSLFVFPLIRPWALQPGEQMDLDRMVAPLPDLILYRMTSGIYYHMRDRFKVNFDEYFGHLLNAYVGVIFSKLVAADCLISEADLRRSYPTSAGKVPDWIIVDGTTAVMIEVKVARIHRIVYATGDEAKLDENLEAVERALKQMHELRGRRRGRRRDRVGVGLSQGRSERCRNRKTCPRD